MRISLVLLTAMIFGGVATASTSVSFTGSFNTDDQLEQFLFVLSAPATITAVTWGYAGGTNQAGATIPEGGFDPWLAIFDSTGALQVSVDNGTCGQVPTDSASGACLDSYINQSLAAGTYTLILSQSDNQPVDNSLADGYTHTVQPTFTGTEFGCSNGQFCDVNGLDRTSAWAVDIDNVSFAVDLPEPGTTLLGLGGLAAIIALRRRVTSAMRHSGERGH